MISSFKQKPINLPAGAALLSCALLLGGCADDGDNGTVGATGAAGTNGITNYIPLGLKRIVTAPVGAEFTGIFLNTDGALCLNVQHPSDSNTTTDSNGRTFDKGTIGVVTGKNFNTLGDVAAMDMPISTIDKEVVITAVGQYKVLAQQADALADGNEMGAKRVFASS